MPTTEEQFVTIPREEYEKLRPLHDFDLEILSDADELFNKTDRMPTSADTGRAYRAFRRAEKLAAIHLHCPINAFSVKLALIMREATDENITSQIIDDYFGLTPEERL